MKVSGWGLGLVCLAVAAASQGLRAEDIVNRVPQGHLYTPKDEKLPPLNSFRDQLDNQTDIYETEIYQWQREYAVQDGQLERLIEHDLSGGTNFEPRY